MQKSILKLNSDIKLRVLAARRRANFGGKDIWKELPPTLTLLHFSDIHGGERNLKRIVKFIYDFKDLLDDSIFTGDYVRSSYQSGMKFYKCAKKAPILPCIGNHDAIDRVLPKTRAEWKPFDWSKRIPMEECDRTYITPALKNCSGEIDHKTGTTYYSKKYNEQGILLITLDSMLQDENDLMQIEFLKEKLNYAKAENLGVIIAVHDAPEGCIKYDSNFCSYLDIQHPCGEGCGPRYMDPVQDFINGGGEFICYISGHTHNDFICYHPDYPTQTFFTVGCAFVERGLRWGDCERTYGLKNEDLFNIITFDRYTKLIKICHVGADRDSLMRSRNNLCFDYKERKIIYED